MDRIPPLRKFVGTVAQERLAEFGEVAVGGVDGVQLSAEGFSGLCECGESVSEVLLVGEKRGVQFEGLELGFGGEGEDQFGLGLGDCGDVGDGEWEVEFDAGW